MGNVAAGTSISQSSVISSTRRNRMMQEQIAKLEAEGMPPVDDENMAEGVIDLNVVKKKKTVAKEKKKLSPVRPIKTSQQEPQQPIKIITTE